MAKKLSPAELKAEGEELSKQIAEIRKKDLNFAMVMGKDALVFHTDLKKNCDVLWRNAKKEAGGAKGAKGVVSMSGKILVLDADDPDSVPTPLLKMAKKHFSERGLPIRIVLKGQEEVADEDEADLEAAATHEEEADTAEAATEEKEPGPAPEAEEARPEEPAPEPLAETGGRDVEPEQEAAVEEKAERGGPEEDPRKREEQLRNSLIQDFKAMKPDLELAANSTDERVKKKVSSMARVFIDQIKTDVKKAHSAMGLMQSTIKAARENGQLGAAPGGAEADNGASNARRKRLATLQKGVDKLLERLG